MKKKSQGVKQIIKTVSMGEVIKNKSTLEDLKAKLDNIDSIDKFKELKEKLNTLEEPILTEEDRSNVISIIKEKFTLKINKIFNDVKLFENKFYIKYKDEIVFESENPKY